MLNEQTVDILRKMKLNAMANELTNQLNDSNTYNSLGFEERLGLLDELNVAKGCGTLKNF